MRQREREKLTTPKIRKVNEAIERVPHQGDNRPWKGSENASLSTYISIWTLKTTQTENETLKRKLITSYTTSLDNLYQHRTKTVLRSKLSLFNSLKITKYQFWIIMDDQHRVKRFNKSRFAKVLTWKFIGQVEIL